MLDLDELANVRTAVSYCFGKLRCFDVLDSVLKYKNPKPTIPGLFRQNWFSCCRCHSTASFQQVSRASQHLSDGRAPRRIKFGA